MSPAVAAMMTAVVRLSTCSGTIVDREWVLSAKHCLSPWNETITSQRPTGHVSRTADLVKYQWNTNVELLHFTPPFEDVPRVPLYSGTTKSIWGRAVTCYGYGGTAELTTGTWLIESREPNVWTIIPNPLGQTFAAGVSGGPCILDDAVVGVIWGWSGVDNNLPVWGAVSDVPSSFDWIATSMTDRRMSSVYADNDRNQRNHTELFRTGTDGYLNYYFASPSWTKDADSLRTTRVMGEVSAVYSMARGHSEVFFQGEDGKLHFSFAPPNSSWNHDSQSFDVAGQLLGKVAAVYAPYDASQPYDGHSEAFVQGSDGMLYRFFVPRSGTWQYENPIGPEVPRGDLSLVYAKHRSHSEVFYVGDDGYLHYAYFEGGRWHCDRTSFMAAGPIRGRVAAVYSDAQNHSEVFARGADGYLHHFFVTGVNGNEVWAHDGSSFVGSGQVDGDIAAVYAPTTDRPHSEVFFRGADGWVHRYFVAVSGENWQHDSASFGAGGPIAGDLTAAFSIARNHTEFFYRGTDGKTHNYYMDPVTNAWIHDDASFL